MRSILALRRPYLKDLRDESGSVILETALVLTAAMTLVLGIVEVCILSYQLTVLSAAAKQGVRYAISHGTDNASCSGPSTGCGDSTAANVVSAVNAYITNYMPSTPGVSVQVTYPDNSSSPSSRVSVVVTYAYQPMTTLTGISKTFSLNSQGRIVY
jgi:Flp pilus assembly protein TadG